LMRRHLLFRGAVLAGVAVVLAGCGGSSDPLRAVLGAATTTLSQSADANVTLSDASLFGGTSRSVVGRAAFVFPTGLGYEAIQVPKLRGRASGTAYLAYLGRRVWVEPLVQTALPQGRLWISTTFSRSGSLEARFPTLALVLEGLNPELLLEEIIWGAVAASSLGQRVVAHVPFTEYSVTVDLRRAISRATGPTAVALSSAMREELAALRSSRARRGSSAVAIAIWVDGPGRLVQLQASLPGSGLGTVLMALSNVGTAIATNLPTASMSADIALLRPAGIPSASWLFTGGP
jgi:hypothetical protein